MRPNPSSSMEVTTGFLRALTAALFLFQTTRADDDEYFNQFTVCADSAILVEDLAITCDSPGAYYYGSSKYRDSATCMGGDKGKLQFIFEIAQELETDPYLVLEVEAYGSVPSVQLYDQVDLCSLGTLQSLDGVECPAPGLYMVTEKFYFDKQNDEYDEYNFKPVPSIGFVSDQDKNYFDLGGANTDACAGGTFKNWSTGMGNTAGKTIRFFLVTFGVLLGATGLFLAWRYFVMKRELDASTPNKKEEMEEELLDEEDVRRIAMLAREKDLIDA